MRGYRRAEERARRPSFYPTAPPRPPKLRPEEGGACLADPPGALEISSLGVSRGPWGSGTVERPCQNQTLAWRPTLPPGLHRGLHRRAARRPHAASSTMCGDCGGPTQGASSAGRTRGGSGAAGHSGVWRGRASATRLTMIPMS